MRVRACGARRIKFQMELFNLHIQQGRDLCSKLSSVASVIKTPPAQLQTQLAIEVVSPILANSQNPLVRCHHTRIEPARAAKGTRAVC